MAALLGVTITAELVWKTVAVLFFALFVKFVYRLRQVRLLFRKAAAEHGVPMLPHSFLLGHLGFVGKAMAKYPRDVHGQNLAAILMKEYPELEVPGVMYIDTWPIGEPILAVLHPDMMAQFCQETVLPKHPLMRQEFHPITQMNDLVNQSGADWKKWRAIFNPGFSAKNILSLMPAFLEEIDVLVESLRDIAKSSEVVRIEDIATMTTIDIIGRATLGIRMHCQTSTNELQQALSRQIGLVQYSNAPDQLAMAYHPLRPFRIWNNNRIIKNYALPHINRVVREYLAAETTGPKTITSLAVKSYLEQVGPEKADATRIDQDFVEMIISQLKIFIFAGHDTTATTLSYAYYLLDKHPAALASVRAEFDKVFGPDSSTTRDQLAENPSILNQLHFLGGVVKETLRLFPPASTIRQGNPEFFLVHPDTKKRYPTDGFMMMGSPSVHHRMEEFWPRASEFVPERWLASEGEPLHPRKHAFRAFEVGPRNCIGQELAQLEIKAILALTLRDMDIESVYPDDSPKVFGDVAYQIAGPGIITAHIKWALPARVRMRRTKE